VVSCGALIGGVEVRVVDDDGNPLPERQVGEIILRGNSMLSGYYRRPDITAESLRQGWFYTGDMGYLADGEVYISGRKKDMIIVGGKNIYPQDLEAIANTVAGIHPGRAVAFGVMDAEMGTEGIVMVCELEAGVLPGEEAAVERDLRSRVVRETEVTLMDVRLVDKTWLIKTSSGKLARNDSRAKYLREFGNRGQAG
jgi:acyl-CoA synthetase (AMP-forming)/AMP-acid ligase II